MSAVKLGLDTNDRTVVGDRISQEMTVAVDTIKLGWMEVLVTASDKSVLSLGLFLKRDGFPCRARLGPVSGLHIDRIGGRGW